MKTSLLSEAGRRAGLRTLRGSIEIGEGKSDSLKRPLSRPV
ncbi:hypothetical protein AC72_4265 [Escherichia coli 2-316-03_S4_C1]|nr:hypothetical protein HMPREF9348_03945 [Escherichia coli MS 145-7]KDY08588.1 hypothetical protein AC72_4265 [Escherichia coli 2-316-03_S4_C1]